MPVAELIEKLWIGLVGLVVAGISWLIRRVLTNERQIALLKADSDRRTEDIKEMRADLKELLRRRD